MRFETSQSTPSYLDRRLQLRMLSCVGVISIVMVTLSLARHRSSPPSTVDQRSATAVANLSFAAAPIEHRVLKPDEVIILPGEELEVGDAQVTAHAHQGPRGQWADDAADDEASHDRVKVKARLRADDPANGDLFQPRELERSGTSPLFERRHVAKPIHRDANRPPTDSLWDDVTETPKKTNPVRGRVPERAVPLDRKTPEWYEHAEKPAAPPRSDPLAGIIGRDDVDPDEIPRKSPVSKPAPSRRDESQIVPPRSKPLLDDEAPPRRSQPVNDRRLADDRTSPGDDSLFDLTLPPVTALPTRKKESPSGNSDSFSDAVERGTRAIPIDLRRRDDGWRTGGATESERDSERRRLATVEIDKSYLDVVQDNTMGIRREEAKPYYWLLDHARSVAASKLEKAGRRDVLYLNLMTEPDQFRGEPITIEGDLWRLYEYEASRNDYGVERVYEGWVFTGDSANNPYRVVFTSLPRGIEPGENLRKPVRLTGYFFKREGYPSNGGVHFAPTLLARRIGINPMPNGIPLTSGIVPYMIVVIMAVGLGLLVTTVGFAISDERSTRQGRQHRGNQPLLSFAGLAVPSPVSVEESLREFAERERQTAISGAYGPLLSRQAAREHAVHSYSTSKQFAIDDQRRQQERQNGILQDWSARQKAVQSENELAHGTRSRSVRVGWPGADDLDSDNLAPVRALVPKGNSLSRTVPEQSSLAVPSRTPLPTQTVAATTAEPLASVYAARVAEPQPVHGQTQPSAIAQPSIPTNISYGASKLSEWEDEVAKLSNRSRSRGVSLGTITVPETSNSTQIEQDRIARERVIRERVQRQQEESEQQRREQRDRERIEFERLERERIERERQLRDQQERERQERLRVERERMDRERLEYERLDRERAERERLERERVAREQTTSRREYDRTAESAENAFDSSEIADSTGSSSAADSPRESGKRRGGGWGWPARRKNKDEEIEPSSETFDESFESTEPAAESDSSGEPRKRRGGWGWPRRRKESEQTPDSDETLSDDSGAESDDSQQSSFGWGRRRKHRRNWRNSNDSPES
ncbi:hypothetical protein [Schlesneria paludicola]|uniref:hypothetical protein n=1 Tax=Schlesneria paludicola TaxID=360056 RepID=UPI00029A0513|nr:hypothetical protein [Schlesneria paludicola]